MEKGQREYVSINGNPQDKLETAPKPGTVSDLQAANKAGRPHLKVAYVPVLRLDAA